MLILNAEIVKVLRSLESVRNGKTQGWLGKRTNPTANSNSGHESVSKVTGWEHSFSSPLQKECLTLNTRHPGTRERELAEIRTEKRLGFLCGLSPRRLEKTEHPSDSG